jgi:hypothetical protein
LQVAPSTYYSAKSRPLSARAASDAILIPLLMALFVRNYSVYGRRKLTKAARKAGLDVGRDQVARLMRQMGIRGASRAKKRFTTRADPTHVRAPDLVKRHFVADRPDALWVADFTYCSTWSGIVYVLVTWNQGAGWNGPPASHELRGRLRLVPGIGGEVGGAWPPRASVGVSADVGGSWPRAADDRCVRARAC